MKKILILAFLFSFELFYSNNLFAAKYYVNDAVSTNDVFCIVAGVNYTGSNSNTGTSASSPKLTLTNLLATFAASFVFGDTIFIDAGSYTDKDLSSPINGVVLKGAGNSLTIFSNPGADNYFMRIDDNNTVLIGMKIVDFDDAGGGVGQALGVLSNVTGVNLINIIVNAGTTTSGLSGYPLDIASGANVNIVGGGSTCNNWDAGGGIRVVGATTVVNIRNYAFTGNLGIFSEGTALRINNGTVNVYNTIFENNAAEGDRRGAAAYVVAGTVNFYDCKFNSNKTRLSFNSIGGSILIDGGNVKIKRSTISGHTQTGGSTSYGAGVGVTGGTVSIDSCSFSGNSGSTTRGTDFYNNGGTVIIRDCTFSSASNQIGCNAGTTTITTSGSPSSNASYRTGLTLTVSGSRYSPIPMTPTITGTCASGIILPVELSKFEVNCNYTEAELLFETMSERNNDYFLIEKAGTDGVFNQIAEIDGSGTSSVKKTYNFTDFNALKGTSYYRLSQVDLNGKMEILSTKVLQNSCLETKEESTCYYNPLVNEFIVQSQFVNNVDYTVYVVDALGKKIALEQFTASNNLTSKNLKLSEGLSNALYFVIIEGNNKQESIKVVKY